MTRKYPAVFVLLFVVVGILLADQTRWSAELFLLAAVAPCLVGLALLRSSPGKAALLFGLFMLSFAAFHFSIRYYDIGPNHLFNFIEDGQRYQLFGRVIDWPELKSYGTEIKIAVDSLGPPVDRAVTGAVLLKVSDSTTALQRGDRVQFRERVFDIKGGRSPGGFDYRRYLHLKGVVGVVYMPHLLNARIDTGGRWVFLSWVDELRRQITCSFQRNLGESGAALAAGFLIGETRDIPPEVYQRFRDSGTLHLLAVSGSNVALVLAFVTLLLRPFGLKRRRRALVLLGVIVVFALLSYGEPSVVRASVMATLVIGAGLVQRRYDLNNVIAVAALIILLYDPAQLFDVGFQLSFVVAWGLIYVMPKLHRLFEGYHARRWYRWLVFPISIALIAQVCSAPLTAYHFHRVPLISPVANLVIVPLVSLAVVASLGLLLAHLIWPLLGMFVGSLLNLHMNLILWSLDFFGDRVPVWEVSQPSWIAAAAVFFVLGVGVPAVGSRRWRRVLLFGLVGLLNLALVDRILSSPPGDSLHLFSIPGGVCAVYKQPQNRTADIIITGAIGRRYRIDEKILAPALTALDVDRLSNLVILGAEFGAVDDLLRLASRYQVESLYVAGDQRAAFEDVRNSMEPTGDSISILYFSGRYNPAAVLTDGWRLGRHWADLTVGTTRVMFVDFPDPLLLEGLGVGQPAVLVVGSSIDGSDPIYERLRGAGTVCTMSQGVRWLSVNGHTGPNAPDSTIADPGFLIDLSRRGGVELGLQSQPTEAVQVIAGG